jgi:nucleoside-triphosphatase THEP1
LALELAAESLPSFIANIPDLKSLIRKPVSIFYQVISQAERRLSEIKTRNSLNQKFFIVTGSAGSGKTTFVKNLIDIFRKNKIEVGGIISERVISNSQATGYDLINIENGEKEVFLRQNEECGSEKIGRYTICTKGLKFGNNILGSIVMPGNRIVVIDEVGLLELRNKGWFESIDKLLGKPGKHLLLVVRNTFVDKIISKWDLSDTTIFNIEETDYVKAGKSVMEQIGTVLTDHNRKV